MHLSAIKVIISVSIIFLIMNFGVNLYSQTTRFVLPKNTDSQIDTATEAHFICVPSNNSKNKLFLFLPGTGALPRHYQTITTFAASQGFNSIALNYPNFELVNGLCSDKNLDCYEEIRRETLLGDDLTSIINVNKTNSIKNRLTKLLIYLNNSFPNENWGRFILNNEVQWNNIIVAGHSQGGGYAGYITKVFPADRCLIFAAMDYNKKLNQPATWQSKPSFTNAKNIYYFIHKQDELVSFQLASNIIWDLYKITSLGIISIDSLNGSSRILKDNHCLYSDIPIQSGVSLTKYHGCIVADASIPKNTNGKPVFENVWEYMLNNNSDIGEVKQTKFMPEERGSIQLTGN